MVHSYNSWPKGSMTQKIRLRTLAKSQEEPTAINSTDHGDEKLQLLAIDVYLQA